MHTNSSKACYIHNIRIYFTFLYADRFNGKKTDLGVVARLIFLS